MPKFSVWFRRCWLRRLRWSLFLSMLLIVLAGQSTLLDAIAQTAPTPTLLINQATARYSASGNDIDLISNPIQIEVGNALIDPAGTLLGCDGLPLSSYAGFSMSLYEPDASGLGLGNLVQLTTTTGADSIPPNSSNVNPFPFLAAQGKYNFLLDATRSLNGPRNLGKTQTAQGAEYILVINPPAASSFTERRIRLVILGVVKNTTNNTAILSYRATALDGQPIGTDGQTELVRAVEIRNAAVQSLIFFELGVNSTLCDRNQMNLVKSADRSSVQPGDTVVYRLLIQNLAKVGIDSAVAVDTLPLGFQLIPESVSGMINGTPAAVAVQQMGSTVAFNVADLIGATQKLEIIYATRVTADAVRGSGRNSAIATAQRIDNRFRLQDGPRTHRMSLDPGIYSDCGTLIGRVFEDKNFDGEQQPGEAGIANAVIFLDDGNRVVTDADGLFSLQKVLPGQRTGTLDLVSLPGYTLAPNLYFNERNSYSRLVNLAPGGLGRMNFGVTPTFQEGSL